MGEVWIKEAEQLTPVGSHNAMSGIGGPRATLHCTVSNPGSFDAMVRVLRSKSSESHLLYDPKTDRLGQFFPLTRAARALARGTLAYSHNRVGSVNIQIEVCAMPVDWTAGPNWNPGPNFRAMLRAIRSHGIADEFIFRPARTPADRATVVRPNNMLTSTAGGGKWWGHCHYGQGESHWDPGPIDLARFFGAATTAPPPPPSNPEPAPAPPQETDMQLTDLVDVRNPDGTIEAIPFKHLLNRMNYAYEASVRLEKATSNLVAGQAADKAASDAILKALTSGQSIDLDAVRAAAQEGAAAALDAKIADATTVLGLKPEATA